MWISYYSVKIRFKKTLIHSDRKQITDSLRREVEGGVEGREEEPRSDGYVHYLDCDDGFMDIFICQSTSHCTL